MHDEDGVRGLDSGEPVGDEDGGTSCDHAGEGEADAEFGVGVDGGGGLVEYEDTGGVGESAGEGDELLLSGGEGGTALADGLVELERQGADEVGDVDFFCGGLEGCVGDPVGAEADVVGDGSGEEEGVLQDDTEALAQGFEILLADVDSVDEDLPALDVVKAHHESGYGGFSCASVSDDGGGFIGFHGEGYAAENPLDRPDGGHDAGVVLKFFEGGVSEDGLLCLRERLVGEPHVAEFDASGLVSWDGVCGGDDLGGGVEQVEDALAGSHGGLEDVVFVAELLDGAEEALGVLDEGDEDTEGDGAEEARSAGEQRMGFQQGGVVEDGGATAPEDEGDGGGAEELDDGVVEGVGEDGVGPGLLVLVVDGGEVVEGAALAVEELYDGHAGDVLLGEGVDAGGGESLAAVGVADVAAEDFGDVEDGGDDGEGEQRERPVHADHDGDDEDEQKDVLEDGQDAGGEHLVESIDVGGDAGDEFADGVAIEEGRMHGLDMAEDLAAEIEHDFLSGPLHEVGLDEFEAVGEEEGAEVDGAQFGDAGEGAAAEMAGDPGEVVGRGVGHVGVYGNLDEVGA